MTGPLDRFERIARSLGGSREARTVPLPPAERAEDEEPHPFETRNIHPDLPAKVRKLFDNGHWEQSVFEAFKFIEKEVKRLSGLRGKTGYALMMDAFNENNAKVKLNALLTDSELDEQRGYKSIFAGAAAGIRNPRGHEIDIGDTPDELSITSRWPRCFCGGSMQLACARRNGVARVATRGLGRLRPQPGRRGPISR